MAGESSSKMAEARKLERYRVGSNHLNCYTNIKCIKGAYKPCFPVFYHLNHK